MSTPATPPKPAEGPRDDDGPTATKPAGGVSAQQPAEGGDDVEPRQPGSPQG